MDYLPQMLNSFMRVITNRVFKFLDRWRDPKELALVWRGDDRHWSCGWWIEHAESTTGICPLDEMEEYARAEGIDLD